MKKLLVTALLLCALGHAHAQQPDPCQFNTKVSVPVSQVTSTTLFTGAAARKNYICSFSFTSSDAENLSVIEGTGTICATSPLALIGAATAASGVNLPTNGNVAAGNGAAAVVVGTNRNFNVCLLQSSTGRVSGVLTYVQQ